jgi:hypothetical protein
MATNSVSTPKNAPSQKPIRRRRPYISGLVLRVLIALLISWMVIMIFFVTAVASH